MKKQRVRLLILGMIVASTTLTGLSYMRLNDNTASAASLDRYINVTGVGSIQVKPDMATIQIGVTTNAKTANEAQKTNANTSKKVIQAVQKLGVKESDINTQYLNVYPVYDYEKNVTQVRGYSVNNQLSITVQDVSKAGEIVNAAMAAGANNLNGVSYDVKDRAKYYDQAVEKAMSSAKSKATAIAKVSGQQLGSVVNVSDSSYDYSNGMEVMVESDAIPATDGTNNKIGDTLKPSLVKISANLNVTFGMK